MSKRFLKVSLLGLLLVMCMSVAMAADVSEDTTSEVAVPSSDAQSVDTTDYVITENNNNANKQTNPTRSYNPITVDTCINDSTWDNQLYEVYSNVKITTNISQSNNIAFNLNGNNITIDGLNIVNDETQPIAITALQNSQYINILNTNITVVNTEETETMGIVLNNANNVLVDNCKINLSAVSQDLYTPPDWTYALKTSAILVDGGNNITLNENTVNICNSTSNGSVSGTGEAITVRNNANQVNVVNNIITGEDFPYLYGINIMGTSNQVLIENNTVNLTSGNYIGGIQLTSTSNSVIRRNTITGTSYAESGQCAGFEAFAYGIVVSSSYKPAASESTNNLIEFNNIDISANVTYGIELNIADSSMVYNNTLDVDGEVVMALGMYNSSSCQIKDNNFTVTGNTRTLNGNAYEAIPPVTTGIKITCDENDTSQYNTIMGNIIRVNDTNNTNIYDIILENTNHTTIKENYLKYLFPTGFRILNNGYDTTITQNHWLI